MRLIEGDNHVISARDGLAVCQVWTRPDLSAEDGAKNARQMVEFLSEAVFRPGSPHRGIIFDLRRGPPVFGPRTRETLASFLAAAAQRGVGVAVLAGASAIQVLQFRNLCRESGGPAEVFENEAAAVRWFNMRDASARPRAESGDSR